MQKIGVGKFLRKNRKITNALVFDGLTVNVVKTIDLETFASSEFVVS